jgi:hypothetical protein
MPAGPGRARVRFDTDALADDLARLSPPGQTALRHAHDRFKREGVPPDRLRACQDEHRAGTSLPGCLKIYLPDWDGDWRMIFQIATDEAGPLLSYLACGVSHQPGRHTSSRRLPDRPPAPSRPMAQATAVMTPPTPRPTARAATLSGRTGDPKRQDASIAGDRPPERRFRSRAGAPSTTSRLPHLVQREATCSGEHNRSSRNV